MFALILSWCVLWTYLFIRVVQRTHEYFLEHMPGYVRLNRYERWKRIVVEEPVVVECLEIWLPPVVLYVATFYHR